MRSSLLFSVSVIFASSFTVAQDAKCKQGLQAVFAPLSDYPPAKSYCSSKYGIQTTTRTAAGVTFSSTYTAPALTVVTTETAPTQTNTITATAPASVSTISATVSTETATATVAGRYEKRRVQQRTGALLGALWTVFVFQAKEVDSTFCSCVNPHPLTTITPTISRIATVTPTVTRTSSLTPVATITTTVTPVVITTISLTATTTVTVTSVPAGPTPSFCPIGNSGNTLTGAEVGCKDGCFCDNYIGGAGVCNNGLTCLEDCSSSADCRANHICVTNTYCNGGNTCAPMLPCGSGNPLKEMALARGDGGEMWKRMNTTEGLHYGENRRLGSPLS
ncbi:hypothetical protein B0J11DRAFT_20902 [Dendryphion nanum]|uniref:Antifreeze protein n=1 Tax=Dendryphion nanum TaxID=256645 RepID=A0A9P9EIS8_9PLEO|nr:hypothetical protein B0J11DRAFT_20902 [Dendryphion nanum]